MRLNSVLSSIVLAAAACQAGAASIHWDSYGPLELAVSAVSVGDFSGDTGGLTRTFTVSGPGDDFYQVNGTGTGSKGGLYSLTSTPAAVPEPRSWALALSALATMALLQRRGRSRDRDRR